MSIVPEVPKWASFVPNRPDEFKLHRRERDARMALEVCMCDKNYYRVPRADMHVYELVDGQWVVR